VEKLAGKRLSFTLDLTTTLRRNQAMLAPLIIELLVVSVLMLLAGWISDLLHANTHRITKIHYSPQPPFVSATPVFASGSHLSLSEHGGPVRAVNGRCR
jgi:hypothetical protein